MKNDANFNRICDAGEGSCWDIYGQYISKDGALIGRKIAINTDSGNQLGGVGCLGGKCLALVNSGIVLRMDEGGPAQVGEVYGAFLTSLPDCIFNWAEATYPSLFAPAGTQSTSLGSYYLRYYTGTISYLGTSSIDQHLYYLGPWSSNTILDLGPALTWYATAGCQ